MSFVSYINMGGEVIIDVFSSQYLDYINAVTSTVRIREILYNNITKNDRVQWLDHDNYNHIRRQNTTYSQWILFYNK